MSAGEQVIAALHTAGIPAEAAYPGSKMPDLTAAAARVTEESETDGAVAVAVTLLCPFTMGSTALQSVVENAASALKGPWGRSGWRPWASRPSGTAITGCCGF